MASAVYVLCAVTSLICSVLLFSSYRRSKAPFLFWSGLCFTGLALNNIFLLGDYIFAPQIDFSIPRNLSGAAGTGLLLYGLLWKRSIQGEA